MVKTASLNPFFTQNALQHLITPEEYLTFIGQHSTRLGSFDVSSAWEDINYRQKFPSYRLSVCPYCQQPYTESLNTYGLEGWHVWLSEWKSVYDEKSARRCNHFIDVQTFLNLNGFFPDEISSLTVTTGDGNSISPVAAPPIGGHSRRWRQLHRGCVFRAWCRPHGRFYGRWQHWLGLVTMKVSCNAKWLKYKQRKFSGSKQSIF